MSAIGSGNRRTISAILSSIGISLGLVAAYVLLWELMAPEYYLFLILGTYAVLGISTLLQLVRMRQMETWARRIGALGVVVGLTVTIFLGLRPRTACLDADSCLSGLTFQPIQLLVGILVTTVALYLDVRDSATPLGND